MNEKPKRKEFDKNSPRQPIVEQDDLEFVLVFCEGNPGCATVVGRMEQHRALFMPGVLTSLRPLLESLVDMNIRGSQLWVLYKDIFHGNVAQLMEAIQKRDENMIERLNNICYHPRSNLAVVPYHQLAVVKGWKPE